MHHMLHPDEPCLLRTLKNNGYRVWWGGKNDLVPGQNGYAAYCHTKFSPQPADFRRWGFSPRPGLHGDTRWRGEPGSDTYYSFFAGRLDTAGDPVYGDGDWANVHGAIETIRTADPATPLCIYLPLGYPHPPYGVEDPWFSAIDRTRVPGRLPTPDGWHGKPSILRGIAERQNLHGWSDPRWRELRAVYCGMCARVDHQLGLVLDALRERGIYDTTAVFVFADHGDFTGDYGLVEKTQNTFEDCLTRVPFLIKPPADVPVRPRVSDALVELVDFPATVEAMTGIPVAHTHYGRSLLPVIAGTTDTHRDAVFCEGGRRHGEPQCMELESTENQTPAGLYWPRLSLQRSEGPEHTAAVMCRTPHLKYVFRLYEPHELYDLQTDPGELHNRIDDPAMADAARTLRDRLLRFFVETADAVPLTPDRRW
jgi:arylsulfatase A-like enzyme